MTVLSTEARNRKVIISGAAGGVGSAIVEHLLAGGCRVAACDVGFNGWTFAHHQDVSLHPFDVADWESNARGVGEALKAMGGCDAVVANAGVVDTLGRAENFDRSKWERDVAVNLTGSFRFVQSAFQALVASGDGRVVFISSMAAVLGQPAQVAYSASKAGLLGLVWTLATEWAPHKIKCNAVLPGLIDTPKAKHLSVKTRNHYLDRTPVGRFGEPAEVAGLVAFLLSPAAGYINGAAIRLDGGLGLNDQPLLGGP